MNSLSSLYLIISIDIWKVFEEFISYKFLIKAFDCKNNLFDLQEICCYQNTVYQQFKQNELNSYKLQFNLGSLQKPFLFIYKSV